MSRSPRCSDTLGTFHFVDAELPLMGTADVYALYTNPEGFRVLATYSGSDRFRPVHVARGLRLRD